MRTGLNIANVSWGDHLEWGEGSARLASPDDIARSVDRWIERDRAGRIHFREHGYYRRFGHVVHRTDRGEPLLADLGFDENAEIVRRGHEAGVPVYLYVTIYDELWLDTDWRWPWDPGFNWLSDVVRDHPEFVLVDRTGEDRLWGVLDYTEPGARRHRVEAIRTLLDGADWDGIFLCTRSESRPASDGDRYGFNPTAAAAYRERFGVDPRDGPLDLDAWRRIRGEGLTELLRDVRALADALDLRLSIGIPRGDFMGPPIGNLHLDWRTWLADRIIDSLVIGQIAEICPSAWVHMWPEAEVANELLDPVRSVGLRPLATDLDEIFGPAARAAGAELFLSRLHDHPDPAREAALVAAHPDLTGIQYSTFRRDLAMAAAELPWRRTLEWPDGRNAWDPDRGLVRIELPVGAPRRGTHP
jgi:hypothetical protein